ncbi:MAG: hexitol phosphatase HxpB [Bacteroidetes bacterium]|nr:MAG: hexitol phosphatase HxpB [Bacteroidota bacterium]
MKPDTVIFDMDGLLIDSEPLWQEAANEILSEYGINLTYEQHITTTGLRTKEFLAWWFGFFKVKLENLEEAEELITNKVIEKVSQRGEGMPGVKEIFEFFSQRKFKIGLATSSPLTLVDVVVAKLNLANLISEITSAQHLTYGKPHPQVYLNCALLLKTPPTQCICFEDSFNGMIAAKAARMKCVVVPAPQQIHESRWDAADIKLSSLIDFNEQKLSLLSR